MKQNTQEWLDFRRNKIGASDAAAIMGLSPWQTPYQKWEEKVLGREVVQNAAMKRGSYYEEEARLKFEEMTGISVMPKVVVSEKIEWLMASLDGISFDGSVFVEIKVPSPDSYEAAKKLAKSGIIAKHHNVQMQHQYKAKETLKEGLHFNYSPEKKEGFVVEVKKDIIFIDQMVEVEGEFHKLMVTKIPPELTEKDYQWREDLAWTDLASEWMEVYKYRKQVEEQEEELREKLISASDGQNTKGAGIRVTKTMPKGLVDYNKIPELKGINLDLYRKPSSERWTIALCK